MCVCGYALCVCLAGHCSGLFVVASLGHTLALCVWCPCALPFGGVLCLLVVLTWCYGYEQQQRSERASRNRSRNRTAVCEYI